jgi:hypothetical protein
MDIPEKGDTICPICDMVCLNCDMVCGKMIISEGGIWGLLRRLRLLAMTGLSHNNKYPSPNFCTNHHFFYTTGAEDNSTRRCKSLI